MQDLRSVRGTVTDVQRFSTHDGPGIRTTVFLKGCPLRCQWCHNPECLRPKPQTRVINGRESVVGREVGAGEVLDEVLRDRPYYGADGGLTVSGGEPLMQPEFSSALLALAKQNGLHTCVETSGFGAWTALESLAKVCDLFLFDWKAGDAQKHQALTGAPQAPILDNLDRLHATNARIILRCPIVPGLNDAGPDLTAIADTLKRHPRIERCELMAYHRMGASKYTQLGMDYQLPQLKDLAEGPRKTEITTHLRTLTDKTVTWG